METKARSIFRLALAHHYIDGIEYDVAEEVEAWLKSHKGWLPDPQELYGDGTPLTQPKDEGDAVSSAYPILAIAEAKRAMILLRDSLQKKKFKEGLLEAEEDRLANVQKWLGDAAFSERRSRSPLRETSCNFPYTEKLISLQKDKILALEAQVARLESEVALKNTIIASYKPAFTGFQGVHASPYSH